MLWIWQAMLLLGFLVCTIPFVRSWACTDGNVRCVGTGYFGTINAAFLACGAADPCVLMLSNEINPYFETIDFNVNGSSSYAAKGEIVPYDGQTVNCHGDTPVTFSGEFWWMHGGNGGTIQIAQLASSNAAIKIAASGIQIGPNVELAAYAMGAYGISSDDMVDLDGIVIDHVSTVGVGDLPWIVLYMATQRSMAVTPSVYESHRLIVRGCRFTHIGGGPGPQAVLLSRWVHALLENNYFKIKDQGIVLYDMYDVTLQNNVIVDDSSAGLTQMIGMASIMWRFDIVSILHNTFVCGSTRPSFAAISIIGAGSADMDPQNMTIANNLFSGTCAGPSFMTELVQASGAHAVTEGPSSRMISNRIDQGILFVPAGWTWIDDNALNDGGMNLAISFDSSGDDPDPFYRTTATYTGTDVGVASDYAGAPRGSSPAIGAFERSFTCNGEPPVSACNMNGTCLDQDYCKCWDHDRYAGGNCDTPVCFGELATNVTACGGTTHGTCVGPDDCHCLDNWDNEGSGLCNDYKCADNEWEIANDSCSGRGSCTPTNPACTCLDGFGWTSESHCAECASGWNANCSALVDEGGDGSLLQIILPAVIGPVIGILIIVLIALIVVGICFWMRRPAKQTKGDAPVELEQVQPVEKPKDKKPEVKEEGSEHSKESSDSGSDSSSSSDD